MTVGDDRKLVGGGASIVDLLAMPEDVEFEPPWLRGPLSRAADLS
jgi:hypothetical protein